LLHTGITPIDITQSRQQGVRRKGDVLHKFFAQQPGLDDLILFSRQMYVLMKSGVPITRSMLGLMQSMRNPYMIDAIRDILSNIESGRDLASSLARHPDIFSTLFISMARVGVPAFSIDAGLKYKGHPREWGDQKYAEYRDKVIRRQIKLMLDGATLKVCRQIIADRSAKPADAGHKSRPPVTAHTGRSNDRAARSGRLVRFRAQPPGGTSSRTCRLRNPRIRP
jgi:hypothetical protein